jgi:hypothetical protein
MNDRELVERFEACTLDSFHHADHVHVAWCYLRQLPFAAAAERFTTALRRFAANAGRSELYHETITWAYLVLIRERMSRGEQEDFETFRADNPDLFTWKPSILDRYYAPEVLGSDLAKRAFLLPAK